MTAAEGNGSSFLISLQFVLFLLHLILSQLP